MVDINYMNYGLRRETGHSFSEAVAIVKKVLVTEGFGFLTEIDVRATLKKKLSIDWDNYVILGACNPNLAYQALQVEKEIGLFLPCNVLIYEDGGKVFISAILPTAAMGMIKNEELLVVASQAEEKLKRVIETASLASQ